MKILHRAPLTLSLPCWIVFGALVPASAAAGTLQVGPDKQYKAVKDAVAAAQSGDTIEVDPGEYVDDISSIKVGDLTIRGVGGARAHLKAVAPPPNKKGILVIEAGVGPVTIEHLELSGSKISEGDGNNGAGIRAQGTDLRVRDCYIHDNQNGVLSNASAITIEFSEFANNGEAGYEHNVYVGESPKLVFRGNYSHHAKRGYALKSRALENYIYYNRLMDEGDGIGSGLIDLPQGGLSYVVGNLIQKGLAAENKTRVVLYKGEGGTNPDLRLFVSHNTFVNDGAPNSTFVDVKAASEVTMTNNLFVGPGTPYALADNNIPLTNIGGLQTELAVLVDRAGYDYHLMPDAEPIDLGQMLAMDLTPDSHYLHPMQVVARPLVDAPDVGAYEFGEGAPGTTDGETGMTGMTGMTGSETGGESGATGGATGGETGGDSLTGGETGGDSRTGGETGGDSLTGGLPTTAGPTTAGPTTADGTTGATAGAIDDGADGCGCRSEGTRGPGWALFGLLALVGRRARTRR